MSEEFQAIYEDGVLRLEKPLSLPDHAHVSGVVTSVRAKDQTAPAHSPPELKRLLDEFALPLGGRLPADFSREDIYYDHD